MTREHRHEIAIDATSDQVWRAVTDEEELTRWYADQARVVPGEGGTVTVAWENEDGSMAEGVSRVAVWEPGRRLRLIDQNTEEFPDLDEPTVQEWTIEARGGRTVLRLVHSGFPETDDWDGVYDSTDHGWDMFLHSLRHYLERHPGEPRAAVVATGPLPADATTAWDAFAKTWGVTGGGFRATLPTGEDLSGTVLLERPGKALLASVDELDGGLLFVTLEMGSLWASLAAYGDARSRLDALGGHWRSAMLGLAG
ncbi:MAG TPA: SRPBCC domain-containing protein [Thermomonospora sp.]|nr:SRPBCC domain-containing protein [Thermomonospora sp.]